MISTFILLLLISCAICYGGIEEKCHGDEDCIALEKELLGHVNETIDPCLDIYSYICPANEIFSRRTPVTYRISEMNIYFQDLLSSPSAADDSELLAVEKKLYQSCIELGDSRSQDAVRDLIPQLDNLNKIPKWEDIEYELFSLGFGYSFFNIKVIPHPEYESRNTILLLPPSLENLKSLRNRIQKIIEYKQGYRRNSLSSDREALLDSLFHYINVANGQKVLRFFESVEEAKSDSSKHVTKFPEYYTTVGHLPELKWVKIIKRALDNEKIEFDVNNVVLKNPGYFVYMEQLLHSTSHDVIVSAIITKAITDSLPYIDWKTANSLEKLDKYRFCLKETKLYGASRKMVHDWMTGFHEDDNTLSNFIKSERVFEKIIATIRGEIEQYKSESSVKALYYGRKLYHVYENLRKYVYESPYNIYENLDISWQSYWKNILEYRKLLASSDFEALQRNFDVSRPFSFIDQDEPQNRFVLNTVVNILDMHSPNLPKEAHYGTFGVRTAALIHSLLNEDTYNSYNDDINVNSKVSAYPIYSLAVQRCISDKLALYNSVYPIESVITEILALNTVQKALELDEVIAPRSSSNMLLPEHRIYQAKVFLLAYVQDNCELSRDIIDRMLSYDVLLKKAFSCRDESRQYGMTCMLGTKKGNQ